MQKIDWHNCFEFFTGAVAPNVRMSEKLLAFYHDHPAMNIRSRCSAGITFAMETDAEELALEFVFGESARTIYTCDLSVNGRIIPLDCREPQKTVLGSGVKNVIIYLPNMVVINDFTLAISDGAFYRALPHRQKKLLLCGDSIMQGMTCSTPSRALGALAADALDLELFNTSVGGAIMRSQAVAETLIYGGSNDRYDEGYSDGFAQGETEGYNDGYAAGETAGYDNGYNTGVSDGYSNGVTDGLNDKNSTVKMIFSIFEAPGRLFDSMLGFEIFGINVATAVKTILTLTLTAGIAFFIWKLVR